MSSMKGSPLLIVLLLATTTFKHRSRASGGKKLSRNPVLQEVKFHSVDYRNILQWKFQSHSNSDLKFFVQYKVYGERHWTNATHCQGITSLSCDLSRQTSNPWERYYARVQAEEVVSGCHSSWVLSPRFSPHWETSVSPPAMKLNVTDRGIMVRLKPPRSPFQRRGGTWISMKKIQKLMYRVRLTHSSTIQETYEVEGHVTQLLIKNLHPHTTYCLQAEAYLHRMGRTGDRGPRFCVTTP